jgi:hypothetical protein
MLFGGRFTDLCYGYNAFWSRVVPILQLDCDGFEVETMMNVRALRAGLSIAEVPSFEANRIHGTSNLRTIPDGTRVLKTIVRERFRRISAPATVTTASAGSMVAVFADQAEVRSFHVEPAVEREFARSTSPEFERMLAAD